MARPVPTELEEPLLAAMQASPARQAVETTAGAELRERPAEVRPTPAPTRQVAQVRWMMKARRAAAAALATSPDR